MLSSFGQETITDASTFGKVAVLMGGMSSEREISLKSGNAVLSALQARGVDAHGVDAGRDVMSVLEEGAFDRVFIALHGEGGEDGKIQGALETVGLPYTGTGVLGSALGMDKVRTKQLWAGLGLATPKYAIYPKMDSVEEIVELVGLPAIVKPSAQGSSIGMAKIERADELQTALQEAAKYDDEVLIEQWITGEEYTVAILAGKALPAIKLETPHTFYDYEAKYVSNDTRYLCPCGLDQETESTYQVLAFEAFEAVGCYGWGRVDLMVNEQGPWLLEVNTVPGMTDHSLVPMAAKQAGIDFQSLVWRILEQTVEVKVN